MRYGAQRNSSSSRANAAATIGNSCALVPIASRSLSIASSTFEVPVKDGPSPSLTASTHQRCHRKPCRRRVPKSDSRKPSSLRSRSTLVQSLALARAKSTSSAKRPWPFMTARERRNLPHGGVRPRPVEMQLILALDLAQLIFGQAERREPVDVVRREHVGLAVERVAGEPDQLLLGEADGAGVVELGAQLAFVDDLGQAHMAAAVDDRK